MGSTEPLGSPSNYAKSTIKLDSETIKVDDVSKLFRDTDASGIVDGAIGGAATAGSVSSNKRKRSMLNEEDIIMMTAMTNVVNNVADAIHETKVEDVHPGLYEAVMFLPGFQVEALLVAYGHMLDNKALGTAFVNMNEAHRVLWLRTYLAKHYYN
jgi:hypothetical protein